MMENKVTRRGFVATVAAAGAGAATACIDKAHADVAAQATSVPAWLGEKPVIEESEVIEEADCEVLVCGSGMSGCFCASFAAEGGADVLWIESEASGSHMRSSGVSGINTRYQ